MINRILNLPEQVIDGVTLPVIPIPSATVTEQTDGHFTLHGPEELAPSTAVNRTTHPTIAWLWRAKDGALPNTGLYAVAAEADVMARIDKEDNGESMADYSKTAMAADWPTKNDDGTIAVPSVYGPDDPRPVKAHRVTIDEEAIEP